MKTESVAIGELHLDPSNARKHDDKNLDAIKGSLQRFGQQKPIVVDEKGVIIAGNGTFAAAKALGWETVNVVRSDLKGADRTAYALADNRTTDLSVWDDDVLGKQLQALYEDDFDIGAIGFALDDFLDDPSDQEKDSKEDEIPETEKNEFGVELGQVWSLGKHRLICGDGRNSDVIQKLTEGNEVDLVFTDPPYGVNYVGGTKEKLKIENDNLGFEGTRVLVKELLLSAPLRKGGAFYICSPAGDLETAFRLAILDNKELNLKQQLVWLKDSLVLGRSDYHYRHESILYGWKSGAKHFFTDDRTNDSIWEFPKPRVNKEHPTMKPVELVQKAIKNSTRRQELVFDCCGGSGSTLIACEKTDRFCRIVELDPHYCSVIIKRWQEYTGAKAQLTD